MIADPVTTRYAGALYNLAQRENALDAVTKDIDGLTAQLRPGATGAVALNPRAPAETKRKALAGVLASVHPLTRNFVMLLIDKRREDVLRGLAHAFRRRVLDERGVVEGIVESARPLSASEIDAIAKSLGARLAKVLALENRIVPELVGGARVTAGNRMIDYSVQGRLEALRRKLMDVRLPSSSGR